MRDLRENGEILTIRSYYFINISDNLNNIIKNLNLNAEPRIFLAIFLLISLIGGAVYLILKLLLYM